MTADSKVDLRYRQITYLYPQVKRLFSEQLQAFDPIYKSFDFDRLLGWHTLSVISSYLCCEDHQNISSGDREFTVGYYHSLDFSKNEVLAKLIHDVKAKNNLKFWILTQTHGSPRKHPVDFAYNLISKCFRVFQPKITLKVVDSTVGKINLLRGLCRNWRLIERWPLSNSIERELSEQRMQALINCSENRSDSEVIANIALAVMPVFLLEGIRLHAKLISNATPEIFSLSVAQFGGLGQELEFSRLCDSKRVRACNRIHGGGYFVESNLLALFFENLIAEKLAIRGKNSLNGVPLGIPKSPPILVRGNSVVLVLIDHPKIALRNQYTENSQDFVAYCKKIDHVAASLAKSFQLSIRPYPKNFSGLALRHAGKHRLDTCKKSITKRTLVNPQLIVFSYLGTGFFEYIARGGKAICILDESVTVFHDSFWPVYEACKQASLFVRLEDLVHDDNICTIVSTVSSKWRSAHIQSALRALLQVCWANPHFNKDLNQLVNG